MLPTDAKTRKEIPIHTGFVKYFPDAMAAVAQLSFIANEQHNPGQHLHWSKDKSSDHLDAQMRHLVDDTGDTKRDGDGVLHLTKNAWRAMAQLQTLADRGVDIFAVVDTDENLLPPAPVDKGKYVVKFTDENFERVEGPFDTRPEATRYANRNPENYAGMWSVHHA